MLSALIDKIGKDKWMHFGVSAFLAFLFALLLPSYIAITITIVIGIAKEVYDKVTCKGSAEWQDLLADVLGSVVGAL